MTVEAIRPDGIEGQVRRIEIILARDSDQREDRISECRPIHVGLQSLTPVRLRPVRWHVVVRPGEAVPLRKRPGGL